MDDVIKTVAMVVMASAVMSVAVPSQADAFFRIGAEARWAPVALESMTQDGETIETRRNLESGGVGVRALFGLKYLSLGPKVNFARHSFEDSSLSYSQIDLNAHVRTNLPFLRLAWFAEGGPSMSLNIGEVGYNASTGVEVDVTGWPLIDVNLGVVAQYASVPIGAGPGEIRLDEGLRGMLVVGADFTLVD